MRKMDREDREAEQRYLDAMDGVKRTARHRMDREDREAEQRYLDAMDGVKRTAHHRMDREDREAEQRYLDAMDGGKKRGQHIGLQEGNVGDHNTGRNDAVIYEHKRG